jgi:hypothetical protein
MLLVLGVGSLLDIVKEFLRAKMMDWLYERFGSFGQWLLNYPLNGLTISLVAALLFLMMLVVWESGTRKLSPILDTSARPYEMQGISNAWGVGFPLIVIIIVSSLSYGTFRYYKINAIPEISLIGYQVYLFRPDTNPFANIYLQNIGGQGKFTVYTYAALALATTDPVEVTKEIENANRILVAHGGGLSFSISPMEKRWFTVIGAPLSDDQARLLRK